MSTYRWSNLVFKEGQSSAYCSHSHRVVLCSVWSSFKLPLKECNIPHVYNVPVKEKVTYLGITILKNEETRCSENFSQIVDKTRKKLNQRLQRDLSLKGRVLLMKAEGLLRLISAAILLFVRKQPCDTIAIDKLLFNFLWKNKTPYENKSVIMNSSDSGGLNFLDFTSLHHTFKTNWIKQFLTKSTSLWSFIPNYILSKIGALEFVLLCDYKIEKLPLKFSEFHQQMLFAVFNLHTLFSSP